MLLEDPGQDFFAEIRRHNEDVHGEPIWSDEDLHELLSLSFHEEPWVFAG